MLDLMGRPVTYLRLSVTDACNYRCAYCMPEDGSAAAAALTAEELIEIARQAAACGVTKVRLTGGEPLIRCDFLEICRGISKIDGIRALCVTTNGARLAGAVPALEMAAPGAEGRSLSLAEALKGAGVSRVNISIDSLRPDRYREITRCGELARALTGLEAALRAGFEKVKVNTVLMGGVNDGEIADFVELTREMPIDVRFIELMPIGPCAAWPKGRFLPAGTVLKRCPGLEPIGRSGVSERYRMPGYLGAVGLIRPLSGCFCAECDRIRVTSDGMLKPCLHGGEEIPLRGLSGEALREAIGRGILAKPRCHALNEGPSQSARAMNAIGG